MMAHQNVDSEPISPLQPFSMTDEESDILAFQEYVRGLSAEALWDVFSHVDGDLYPRRHEAVSREIGRRRLFYVTPYTDTETKLRGLFCWSVLFAALAAALRAIGSLPIHLFPGEKLPFFFDLAAGGPRAALMVLPSERLLATVCEIAVLIGVGLATIRLLAHRLQQDVLLTGIIALLLSGLFLMLAYR